MENFQPGQKIEKKLERACRNKVHVKDFRVHRTIPVVPEHFDCLKDDKTQVTMINNKNLRGNESILFIDDESFIVHVQQKVFERYGYSVTPFVSSLGALNEFKARPWIFDIIICDMAMPTMTGLELAHRIKQIRPDIPAIISTGFSEQINNDNYRDMGVDGFLMKPFSREESLKLIRHLLDNS